MSMCQLCLMQNLDQNRLTKVKSWIALLLVKNSEWQLFGLSSVVPNCNSGIYLLTVDLL